jgi:hypothetical protein
LEEWELAAVVVSNFTFERFLFLPPVFNPPKAHSKLKQLQKRAEHDQGMATATLMAGISNIVGHKLTDVRRGNITSYFEDVKRRSVEDHSAKRPDLTFY